MSAFALPAHRAAKADPALIAHDERHLAAVGRALAEAIAELDGRLAAERRAPGGAGRQALDRDLEVHRLTARLRTLRRFGLDLCLGRMVRAEADDAPDNAEDAANPERAGDPDNADGTEDAGDDARGAPVYIGRLGLTDAAGRRLLIDWRSPAAEPFFAATHANPMGLASRRRYRWTDGRISDYWDEAFTADGLAGGLARHAALDDQSAFIASLGDARSSRMRDVLATIQADQDAIIRARSAGALVVHGGPGTGKTVVALHRAAYLLYADPRLGRRRGGVLFIGPHQPYLDYVADVLPSLGEDGVRICTLRDLLPEGAGARAESDPRVAALKASLQWAGAIETAVRFHEELPAASMVVTTPWSKIELTPDDWAEAFAEPEAGTPHNQARARVWERLLATLTDKCAGQTTRVVARRALAANHELSAALNRAWPYVDASELVSDLWSVPAYLRHCAPWLSPDQVRALRRDEPTAWTVADLPLLDAARQLLGDPAAAARAHRRAIEAAARRERVEEVADELLSADDDGEGAITMLRGGDLRDALADDDAGAEPTDRLAGPFAHVVVDEAQELTDAEWLMLARRCPSGSLTIVGDRAQARRGFAESWPQRLARVGFDRVELAPLRVNYRTPAEVMAEAAPVIRAVLPDADVPTSVRTTGVPVRRGAAGELAAVLADWLAATAGTAGEGTACVICAPATADRLARDGTAPVSPRVRVLTPELAKGLEFDLVVLVDPHAFGPDPQGAVDRYVSMTRATQQLVILASV